MNKKLKIGISFVLVMFCILGILILVDSEPREFSTTLDIERKQITDNQNSLLIENWNEALVDISSFLNNFSGAFLASVSSRFVHVREGLRKEEVAELFARRFDWTADQKVAFAGAVEGKYYPGTYSVPSSQSEDILRELMLHRFDRQIIARYPTSTEQVVKLDVVIKIASLIEREAGGKRDMRIISGVIWNRIFKDMSLDIDATLQYAKGTSTNWWPIVVPEDKKISSPFNTYKHKGLPPTPIASPGLAAIDAALNPLKTNCLFYLHDTHRRIHCSPTYKGHLGNIKRYLQ